ncbi:Fc.00g114580.m01.CDS01 [Cosmosporella sp. VM-42]
MPATDETRVGTSPADLEQGAHEPKGPEPSREKGNDDKHEEKKQRLEPSGNFTGHQKFYVFVLDGVGGMALSGGVNFGLAYVMYTTQDTTKNPIRLFQLPNTLAGDAAVTIIVQCILTWFVELFLVRYDLGNRSVQPIGFIPEPSKPWLRWLFFLPQTRTANQVVTSGVSFRSLPQQAFRGFLLAIAGFLLLWPIGVGALTALGEHDGGDYRYSDRWTPQVFKLLLGGFLGLLTTPLMAMFWLVKAGWEVKQPAEHVLAPESC